MKALDRDVLVILKHMRTPRGGGYQRATVKQVQARLVGGLLCPNDAGEPICSVGILGAMLRVQKYL